ncbi:DUF3592 domain-containing protein [Roseiarcaceae bacterium H3SJ34-1]|uniref:DUF3592 domain-containing protein n=1 Tax=Terripilifer ovatus TaxID=3032367 RepID=UPI003AB97107|nr:DUF3592 domain-containing protein [Roseiarcaceae bacterium H3SJ34-1]
MRLELKVMLVGIACAFSGLIATATIVKWWQVRAASHWLPTPGKIVSARVVARAVESMSGDSQTQGGSEIRNFPEIEFDYEVNGKKFHGTRYSIQENLGNFEIPETMARFPKGAKVTVFYDPQDPGKAVIERSMPEGAFKFMIYLSAGMLIGSIALILIVSDGLRAVTPYLPQSKNAGAAAFLTTMGLVTLRMVFVLKGMADAAMTWPSVKGTIGESGIETLQTRSSTSINYGPWRTVFRSRINYTYNVAGQPYTADRVAFGAIVTSSLPSLVSGRAQRYPLNGKVDVYYDPANPASAVLERRVRCMWILWTTIVLFLGGAAMLVGLV